MNKILEDRSLKSQKEVKIYPLANNILHYKENEDLNKELLSNKNIKNEKIQKEEIKVNGEEERKVNIKKNKKEEKIKNRNGERTGTRDRSRN